MSPDQMRAATGQFFGLTVHSADLGWSVAALLIAMLLSGVVGFERQLRGHSAGLRTHMLVGVGSALMTIESMHLGWSNWGDTRLAAQIVTGIGFLGAGAIVRDGTNTRGLTTAASIWATAGIGIGAGSSPFGAEIAVFGTVIVLVTLWVLSRLEEWIEVKLHRRQLLNVRAQSSKGVTSLVMQALTDNGVTAHSVDFDELNQGKEVALVFKVRLPADLNPQVLLSSIADTDGVMAVSLEAPAR